MATNKARIAVIGTGWWSTSTHIPALKDNPDAELVALCEKLLAANPKTIADVQSGKTQAIGALIGQAKKLNPNVDPSRVREVCLQLIRDL